ncbi:MAG: copper ion binding protein [Nitrospiraceae bacterium]|nr:copper ion binding protein [Nitrospiraceae bacterium]
MRESTFRIEGMNCQHCVMAVKKAVEALQGVESAQVEIGKADVKYDEGKTGPSEIERAITDAGYKVVKDV